MKLSSKSIILILLTLVVVFFTHNFVVQSTNVSSSFKIWAASSLESISRDNNQLSNNFHLKQNGVADSLQKNKIQLQTARGEYESFQIVIQTSNNKYLSNVDVAISDLRNADQEIISAQNITLYREHYVYVDRPSPENWVGNLTPGMGWYADGLIPFADSTTGKDLAGATFDAVPFDLAANKNQPIWVDIYVPRDTPPGKYQGIYTVTSDRGERKGNIELTVWNFELPLQPTMNSYFNPWQDRGESLIKELLKHKVMPGKRIKPEKQKELIDRWGLNSVRLPFWSGANYSTCKLSAAPNVEEIKQAFDLYDPKLLKFVYSADEIDKCPNIEQPIKQWAHNIHQAGAKNLVVMKPKPEFYDDVDIWVVQPQMYQDSQQQIAEVMQQGDEVWFYTGHQTGYSPQWQIDVPPINFRIPQGFIAQSLGLTGVLYSQVDGWSDDDSNLPFWSDDPWRKPSVYQQGDRNFSGEGMLLYPGAPVGINGVVPSIRLKRIRDGIEDYEYISLLKKLGEKDWTMKTVHEVGKNWLNWTKDPETLYSARQKLGEKINQLSSKDRSTY